MGIYVNPESGNHEVWAEKPDGYLNPEEWAATHPVVEPEESDDLGPEYEKRGSDWWKVRFSKKDFLLLCGLPQVAALNASINSGNVMAKTIHDLLMSAEFIDVTDQATVEMMRLLTTEAGGLVFTADQAAFVLQGVKHEEKA